MYVYNNCIYLFILHVRKYKLNVKTFKISLYFDLLQIFYGLTMKRKAYKLYTTRLIKKHKKGKRYTQKKYKNAINRSEKISYVKVKQKNAQS